jgi:molybdate transport system substrate-binding protein
MAEAAGINVLCSGAFRAAYLGLVPEFEAAAGHKVATQWGASVGSSPHAIPARLARGEPADLVILSGDALDRLVGDGHVVAGSRRDLASTGVAMAVRTGTRKPDIGSAENLKRTLLEAGTIALSTSASGLHMRALLQRFGIAEALESRLRVAEGEPAGRLIARGEAEIGFQQMSELMPVAGIDIVGPLPPEVQQTTTFAAGIAAAARNPDGARALLRFLTQPSSAAVIRRHGMEPA